MASAESSGARSGGCTAGIGIGAIMWGLVASCWSVDNAIIASGTAMWVMPVLAIFLPLPASSNAEVVAVALPDVADVGMAITLRSGPLIIEIDYDVDPAQARDFYNAVLKVQRARVRIGAFNWSIARDNANPALWTERYECPTWGDYLRMRDRFTQADVDIHAIGRAFDRTIGDLRIRRRLESPFGSVRWKSDTPDPHQDMIGYIGH